MLKKFDLIIISIYHAVQEFVEEKLRQLTPLKFQGHKYTLPFKMITDYPHILRQFKNSSNTVFIFVALSTVCLRMES